MLPTKYISPQGLPIFLKFLATSLRTKLKKSLLKRQVLFFFSNSTTLHWFCHISKRIRYRYTRVPHPEPSSLLPPHTNPLGRPSAPAPSIQHYAPNLDWWLKKKKKQVLIQGAVHWGKFSSQQQLQALDLRLKAMGFRQVNLGRHKAMRNISISHKSFFFFFKYACLLTSTLKKTDKSIPQLGQRETLC